MYSVFSLNSLKIFRDLVRFKLKNQKQFKDISETRNLVRLELKLTKLIKGFDNKIERI